MPPTHPASAPSTATATAGLPGRQEMEQTVEAYQQLRERCYAAACAEDGKLMGDDAWLRFALNERDLELTVIAEGIQCSGSTYTTQTWDHEHFSFIVPSSAL